MEKNYGFCLFNMMIFSLSLSVDLSLDLTFTPRFVFLTSTTTKLAQLCFTRSELMTLLMMMKMFKIHNFKFFSPLSLSPLTKVFVV